MLPATRTVFMHSRLRGAIRIGARPGSSAGNRSATVRARSQLMRAALISRDCAHAGSAHVPAESGVQVTGGLEMFGDQRRVLIQRIRSALFEGGRQTPMQFGSVGLQL